MAKNPNDVPFVTPFGTARYPWVNEPDTRFAEGGEGVYKIGIIIEPAEAQKLEKQFKQVFAEAFPKKKNPRLPIKEDDEGNTYIELKSGFKPLVYDGKKRPLPKDAEGKEVRLGGGSRVRAAGVIHPYDKGANCGITLFLKDVQFTSLKTGGSGGALDAVEMDDDEDDGDLPEVTGSGSDIDI